MKHALTEYEESFLDDGVVAVCVCGWQSERLPNVQEALEYYREHEANPWPDLDREAANG